MAVSLYQRKTNIGIAHRWYKVNPSDKLSQGIVDKVYIIFAKFQSLRKNFCSLNSDIYLAIIWL